MIYAFIRSFIGGFGRLLMDFYIENSLAINAILLSYALLVFIAHRNYFFILEKIMLELRETNEKLSSAQIRKINVAEYDRLRWEVIRKKVWFPLFSAPQKWLIKICTINALKAEFSVEKLNNLLKEASEK